MHGHVTGNLLIVACGSCSDDHVAALDLVGRLLGARGRVLPMALTPLDITAEVSGIDPADPAARTTVSGQVAVATAPGVIESIALLPPDLTALPRGRRRRSATPSWWCSARAPGSARCCPT